MGQIDTEESGLIGGETEHLLVTLREAVVAVGAHGDEDDRVVRRLEQPGRFDLAQRALQGQLDRGLSAERAYAASVTSMPALCWSMPPLGIWHETGTQRRRAYAANLWIGPHKPLTCGSMWSRLSESNRCAFAR